MKRILSLGMVLLFINVFSSVLANERELPLSMSKYYDEQGKVLYLFSNDLKHPHSLSLTVKSKNFTKLEINYSKIVDKSNQGQYLISFNIESKKPIKLNHNQSLIIIADSLKEEFTNPPIKYYAGKYKNNDYQISSISSDKKYNISDSYEINKNILEYFLTANHITVEIKNLKDLKGEFTYKDFTQLKEFYDYTKDLGKD